MTAGLGLVVVAAGSSRRMGGLDKVWAPLAGDPVVYHCLRRLAPEATRTVVVLREDADERATSRLQADFPGVVLVPGGTERSDSVLNGLRALVHCETVAVHDAARPLASPRLLRKGLALLATMRGAIPVEPVRDTVKRVDNDLIVETLDRTSLRLAQTPQLFHTPTLVRAHEMAAGQALTDDASALEAAGCPVAVFPGESWNLKITTPFDLELAEIFLRHHLTA